MDTSNNPERSSNNHDTETVTDEDFQMLEAMGRIETIDGIDYLDGVALPPDDDEPYKDETHAMDVTEQYGPGADGRLGYQLYSRSFKYPLTNKDMREETIESLASGFGMVYPLVGSNYS